MRKLASIRTITNITPIDKADSIELIHIDGWQVVCKKGTFKIGDLCVYIEIDSFVPYELAPFLSKPEKAKTYQGVVGNRIKSKRILKELSQGLILSLQDVSERIASWAIEPHMDLTDILGIKLWEKSIPAQLAGQQKGNFPSFIPKTDQERIQNISQRECEDMRDELFEVTEKLDGSSMTVYQYNGVYGVCSRNIELKLEDTNTFSNMARELNLTDWIEGYAIQGELIGPGIQGNQYGLDKHQFYVFDIYSITEQKYLRPEVVQEICAKFKLEHVPVLSVVGIGITRNMLEMANGKSKLNSSRREGVVYKSLTTNKSFKCISNDWLTENE